MNLKKEEIRRLQKKLQPINSIVPNINEGGCGVFAYFLSKELSRYEIEHLIYIDVSDEENAEDWNNNHVMRNLDTIRMYWWTHLLINFPSDPDILLDSQRVWSIKRTNRGKYLINLDVKLLREMLKDIDHWNDNFNRKYMLRMARFINRNVKEFVYDYRARNNM